ncbi:MAG: NADH dehydrogenase (quinone) subunit G [Acidobacteria bacterium]|nr:MAG: NADH dehydrogenase (quinone) subunit G [Acidobacteriota bacterium]
MTTVTATTVTLTIDGKPVTVPAGTLLIEAAKQTGIEVPSFCYYPGLALQGACRMCLVSIEKMPKLQTACTTVASNGMVVHTENDEVANARKAMLEFLLTNHPLDCPVCDKGGECELQDMVFRYGASETRFMERKLHHEEKKFSNLVYYDWPRCILCYRCIRVCDEGMDVNAYGIGFRAAHSEIIPNRGDQLECEECGMCIDICPVGALTSGTYRYKTRPWELTYTGAICSHCGDGCKTTLSVRNNEIIRANNRDHSGINGEFLCVKGRFGWDFVNSEKRLTSPLIRRNGRQEPASWEEALSLTAERLKQVIAEHGSDSVAVIGSNRTTNEENYVLQRFARTVLGTNNIDHHRTADYSSLVRSLTVARATDRYATMQDIFEASGILLIGNDPTHQHPLLAYQIRQAVRQRGARLYVINSSEIKLALHQAAHFVKVEPGKEADAVRALAGNGTIPSELSWLLSDNALGLGSPREIVKEKETDRVIIFGDEIQGAAVEELVRWGLRLPDRTRFVALGDYANSRGAADIGLLPHTLPGYFPVTDAAARERYESVWGAKIPSQPGRDTRSILAGIERGEIKALLVFGSNPVKTFKLDKAMLGKLSFLVVAELFPTETADLADVVLPATSFAEKAGTFTNTCGQVQAIKKAMRKAGTRSDLEILLALARRFDRGLPYNSADDVLREIIVQVPGYGIALPSLLAGRAIATRPEGSPPALERPDLVFSSRDSLFTSGSLSRYSSALNSVGEAKKPVGTIF